MIYILTIFLGVLIVEVAVLGEFVADTKRTIDEILGILDRAEADARKETKRK